MKSTRLPGKAMMPILEKPVLWYIFKRLSNCKNLDEICISTSQNSSDDIIEEFAQKEKINIFRGDEEKIVNRLIGTADKFNADAIVRITADCPLIDPLLIDELISIYKSKSTYDYVSNIIKRTYPDGLDTEIISIDFLKNIFQNVEKSQELFSIFITENYKKFNCFSYENKKDLSKLRWTLDYQEDYDFIKNIYSKLYLQNPNFDMNDILKLLDKYPNLSQINEKYS